MYHTVVKGDTLSKIANRYGVTTAQLLEWNPEITDPNLIKVGQVIRVSAPEEPADEVYTKAEIDAIIQPLIQVIERHSDEIMGLDARVTRLEEPHVPDPEPEPEPGPDPKPGVGPREDFTPPSGTMMITTGQNAANIINNAADGTKFLFAAGVHNIGASITTKSGMELYGEYGAILDGGGGNRRIILGGSGGRMENLVVRNFVPPLQDAAVVGQLGSGTDMVLSHCEFYGNTIALYTKSGWQVLNCDIHHQLQLGVSGSGNNVLMDGCEIHHNNTEGHDSHWEAGATKFVHARDLVIRNCYSHDNDGPGFWTDGTVYDALVEDCVAENDRGPGINIEITYGAKVLNNRVVNCGHGWTSWTDGAGILVTSSPDVEVAYNEVIDSRMGIIGQDRNRGSGQDGPYLLQGLWVHHNKTNGLTGIVSQDDRSEPYGEWNNQFDFNEYLFAKSAARFYWANGPLRSGTQWQGYGNDLNGTWES